MYLTHREYFKRNGITNRDERGRFISLAIKLKQCSIKEAEFVCGLDTEKPQMVLARLTTEQKEQDGYFEQ